MKNLEQVRDFSWRPSRRRLRAEGDSPGDRQGHRGRAEPAAV